MDIDDLGFSSSQFINVIERHGLIGRWSWSFYENQQFWSPVLLSILGVSQLMMRPSYELFFELIHPEDRDRVESAAEIVKGIAYGSRTFRIIRPDGKIRILAACSEIHFYPDGRPHGAAGFLFDVTDAHLLQRQRAQKQQQLRELFNRLRMILFTTNIDNIVTFPQAISELTGIHLSQIADDPFAVIVRDEREYWRDKSAESIQAEAVHTSRPLVYIAGQKQERFEVITVPILNQYGSVVDWRSLARPAGSSSLHASEFLREGLEQAICGNHMRAARALLDWSMMDLARASSLSLSTIRRIEEDIDQSLHRSKNKAVEALRRGGVRFSLIEEGIIAVSKI